MVGQEDPSISTSFDPFTIGPDHGSHLESTSIIKLEESGKVFCPLCLQGISHKKIGNIRDSLFDQYVRSLFEALDQHGEKKHLRDIVMPILDIILSRRDICIRSDHDFHNLLRIVYKLLSSDKFHINEFPAISRMFSAISRRFTGSNPIPLVAVSKATEYMLTHADRQLTKYYDEKAKILRRETIKLLGSIYTTVQTYLQLLGRFAIDRSSDLIFPLYEGDDQQVHSRTFHKNCQLNCLIFAQRKLFPLSIEHLRNIDKPLNSSERSMVMSLFESMRECFVSAIRTDSKDFTDYISKEDCLSLAHTLVYKNSDVELRTAIRSFLRIYVLHYIEFKFEPDAAFRKYTSHQDIVETNHKNAILYSQDQSKFNKTIFYVLANYVAAELGSKYFNRDRLKKVIKLADPCLFRYPRSSVIMRVYIHAASMVTRNVTSFDNVERFFRRTWNELRDGIGFCDFDNEFCSSEVTFFWVYQHPSFRKLVTQRSIKHLIENGFSRVMAAQNMLKLLDDTKSVSYKSFIIKYLKSDELSVSLIQQYTEKIDGFEFHVDDKYQKTLMTKLGAIIPTLLHEAIVNLSRNLDSLDNISRAERLTMMILMWTDHCKQFELLLADDFISVWFEVLDKICRCQARCDTRFENLIILFTQFISALMKRPHNQLMKILAKLNYTTLGLMYTWLTDYTAGDRLAENVATMLLAYDELDYPLRHNVIDSLFEMRPNVMIWMLSSNKELHMLSMRYASKVFEKEQSKSTRASIATGLIYMIADNPKILHKLSNLGTLRSIVMSDEIQYNPLLARIRDRLPADIRSSLSECERQNSPAPSPPLSFASTESSQFEEEHISVIRILTQLQNDEASNVNSSCTIPDSLFATKAITDRHVNSANTDDWERFASQINKSRELNV